MTSTCDSDNRERCYDLCGLSQFLNYLKEPRPFIIVGIKSKQFLVNNTMKCESLDSV